MSRSTMVMRQVMISTQLDAVMRHVAKQANITVEEVMVQVLVMHYTDKQAATAAAEYRESAAFYLVWFFGGRLVVRRCHQNQQNPDWHQTQAIGVAGVAFECYHQS